jgi:hypothetical protein
MGRPTLRPSASQLTTLLALALVAAACSHGSTSAGSTQSTRPPHATSSQIVQRRFGRLLTIMLPTLKTSVVQSADNYLAAARRCAPIGASGGFGAYRRCTDRGVATTEAIADGPQLHGPLDTWRTADADITNVFIALVNSRLATRSCRTALRAEAGADDDAFDRLIWKVERAAHEGRYDAVRSMAALGHVRRLDEASDHADTRVQRACES